ncbi:MAG: MarR family transcriptional regulator [Bacillota bacterium]|nr:MarR family transcriptional regulator [Bacillota bacterium]
MTETNEKPEDDGRYKLAARKFMQVDRLHHKIFDKMVNEIGLHRSQHMLLMFLSRAESIPSQKEIADKFDISPAAVAGTIKKLEKEGYIEKTTSADDNRYNEIRITKKGRDMISKTHIIFSLLDEKMFKGFSDSEIDTFSAFLDRMLDNLK